jgi:hypothetical protein
MYTTKIPRDPESSRFSKMPSSIQLTLRAVVLALGAISVVNASESKPACTCSSIRLATLGCAKSCPASSGVHSAAASITASKWGPPRRKITVTGDVDKRVVGSYTENVWTDIWKKYILREKVNSTFTKDDDPNVKISEVRSGTKQSNKWTISVGGVPYFKAENRIIKKRTRKRIDDTIPYKIWTGMAFKWIRVRLGHLPPCRGWTACDKKYGNGASLKLEGDGVYFGDKRRCRDCEGQGKVCETTLKVRWLCKWHTCTTIDCPKCEDGIIYGASKDP